MDKKNLVFPWNLLLEEVKDKHDLGIGAEMLSRVLAKNPLVHGLYWRGEILWRILKIEEEFWKEHREWKTYFEGVLYEVFDSFSEEELKAMIGERPYAELKKMQV